LLVSVYFINCINNPEFITTARLLGIGILFGYYLEDES